MCFYQQGEGRGDTLKTLGDLFTINIHLSGVFMSSVVTHPRNCSDSSLWSR